MMVKNGYCEEVEVELKFSKKEWETILEEANKQDYPDVYLLGIFEKRLNDALN